MTLGSGDWVKNAPARMPGRTKHGENIALGFGVRDRVALGQARRSELGVTGDKEMIGDLPRRPVQPEVRRRRQVQSDPGAIPALRQQKIAPGETARGDFLTGPRQQETFTVPPGRLIDPPE